MRQRTLDKINHSWAVSLRGEKGDLSLNEDSISFRRLGAELPELIILLENIKGELTSLRE